MHLENYETSRKNVIKHDDGQTAAKYETELQLFPKKCEVKLQEHLNNVVGREGTPKNEQDQRSCIRRGKSLWIIRDNKNMGYIHKKMFCHFIFSKL